MDSADEEVVRKSWKDLPEEIKPMVVCATCNQPGFEVDRPLVLRCSHILCQRCLEKHNSVSDWRKKKETLGCPTCNTPIRIPQGGIKEMPGDTFSLVLTNTVLDPDMVMLLRPLPRCGLHGEHRRRQNLSKFCRQCDVQVCPLCCEEFHQGHYTYELTVAAMSLDPKLRTVLDVVRNLLKEMTKMMGNIKPMEMRMLADMRGATALKHFKDLIRTPLLGSTVFGSLQQCKFLQTFAPLIELVKPKFIQHQEKELELIEVCNQAWNELFSLKQSLLKRQVLFETLKSKGNASDKVSRVSGLTDRYLIWKWFTDLGLNKVQILNWHFDGSQKEGKLFSESVSLAETLAEFQDVVSVRFPGFQHVDSVPMCRPALGTRSATLFHQHHILHIPETPNNICIHNQNRAAMKQIQVPDMNVCQFPTVVNPTAGVIVVGESVQHWEDEMVTGQSQTHLSGSLHWITLSNNSYDITGHEVTHMKCVQRGYMNVNPDGHLLVLTLCTTSEHDRQLLVYDGNKCVLHAIDLKHTVFGRPFSAVSIGSDTFVVSDYAKKQITWVDRGGQVMRQFALNLNGAHHIVKHSGGMLLITDFGNHRVILVRNDGTLIQDLLTESDIKYPICLHLDEQEGLLSVVLRKETKIVEVKVFKFWPLPKQTPKLRLRVQV